jgi:5-methyltetrahydrofolate--homocysteine methyltransferase
MMASGLDGAILDPLDREIMAVLRTTEMLLGRDSYCGKFLKAVRAGQIEG